MHIIYFVQKGDLNTMLDTAAIIISQGKKDRLCLCGRSQ